jgi:glycosyltransferase involved in cell wall biosynthesis/predicted metal-dependent phosphoesterase TrpH
MTLTDARADLHCHSTASQLSRLGVQRALGLPECATPPEEVYDLAKRRGMDFVTITDHDTIAGALRIADRPDVFVSEELTARFRGEPQAVHVLCFGIDEGDHQWLQAHAHDLELVAAYLHERDIACALAHPFYAVGAPLRARHRRRLAELFGTWETRNGARAPELNAPAAIYVETHGGTGVGGSDDHAGVDVGRTFTQTPPASTPQQFLAHLRAGRAQPGGDQGSAAKWAHAAMAIAVRALGAGADGAAGGPQPRAVLRMAERIVREGDARRSAIGADLAPADARALLDAWLEAVELPPGRSELLAVLQAEDFSHAALFRRARRIHERKLRRTVHELIVAAPQPDELPRAAAGLFDACVAAIPYAPAAAFLGREKAKLARGDGGTRRVALLADGVGSVHGVTRTLEEVRERGVPGFEVEVLGTDAAVDRRLSAVAEFEAPLYPGLGIGVPSLPAIVDALAEGHYDLVHVCSPGPLGVAGVLLGRVMQLPVVGSYHTELTAYARLRGAQPALEQLGRAAVAAFYGHCDLVLSPSAQSDAALGEMAIPPARVGRWERGVDTGRFGPELGDRARLPGEISVLYSGRLTREKGAALLADAFLAARERDPRLHLCLAGGGPEEEALRERLGRHATFLGWLEGDELARAYASADVFLFASRTDTFGQVLLEAQASGVPVVAVAEGGPCSLVEDGVTGLLRPPDAGALAAAVLELAASPLRREALALAALAAARERTWERSLEQLAAGYARALAARASNAGRRAA